MLNKKSDEFEFEVLGFKVQFRPGNEERVPPARVVDHVREVAQALFPAGATLDKGQMAILVALKLASDKLSLEDDYKKSIEKLQEKALDALNLIEDIQLPQ